VLHLNPTLIAALGKRETAFFKDMDSAVVVEADL
jgi:hypothetical protein